MKENNGANRLARDTIIIASIVAVAITIILGVVISTKLITLIGPQVSAANKTIIMHIHPVLKLTVDGKPVTLPTRPANIISYNYLIILFITGLA
jgi:hypothetical protein